MPDEENATPVEGEAAEGEAEAPAPPPPKATRKIGKTKPDDQQRILKEAQVALKAKQIQEALRDTRRKVLEDREARKQAEIKRMREERMIKQRDEDGPFMAERSKLMEQTLEQTQLLEEWEKYLECNRLPDVEQMNSLSTYLSELEETDDEAHLHKPEENVAPILNVCATSEALSDLMDKSIGRSLQDCEQSKLEYYLNYRNTLRDVITAKIDRLTQGFLHQADLFEDEDKVMTYNKGNDVVKYGLWVHTSAKHTRVKEIHYPDIGISIMLPVALQKTRTCIRAVQMSFEHVKRKAPKDEGEKKKKKKKADRFRALGGVVHLDQFGLPPPPKEAKGWIMREITPLTKALLSIPYPSKVEGTQASNQGVITLTYKVPDEIYINNDFPEFGWWDEVRGVWEREGISAMAFDTKTRVATLQLGLLKPFAIVQPRAVDFPYLFWSISTTPENTVRIKVQGSRFTVEFEAVGGKLQLLAPNTGVLSAHCNQLMDPGVLLLRLAKVGLNLIPSDDDAKFCRKAVKMNEDLIHSEVAKVAGVVDLQFSSWNGGASTDSCIFEVQALPEGSSILTGPPPPKVVAPDSKEFDVEPQEEEDENEEVKLEEPEEEDEEAVAVEEDATVPEEQQDPKDWIRILCVNESKDTVGKVNFSLVMKGEDYDDSQETCVSENIKGTFPQSCLRRSLCLYLDAVENSETIGVSIKESFQMLDQEAVALQKTIFRTLNLLRPFSFS